MVISKCRTILSPGIALGACFINWLIMGESSPLADYFLYHVEIPNLWRVLHILPYLFVVIFRTQIIEVAIYYFLVFLQWLLLGYVVALLVCRRAERLKVNPT